MPSRVLALLIALCAFSQLEGAQAQTVAPESDGEPAAPQLTLTDLEATLSDLEAKLSTADCDVACAALSSMVRAAEQICELEAGDRCSAARKRVEDARNRVLRACPDCAAAETKRGETAKKTKLEPEGGGVDEEPADADGAVHAIDSDDGGCATCTVGGRGNSRLALTAMFGLAFLLARRRRRSQ